MKHINIYILLIGLSGLIFMSSCGEDAFSTTVELEQPEVEDRLVVNAFVTDEQQESLSVYVGRNVGILEDVSNWWLGEDDLYSLNDATVKLKKPSTNEVLDFEFNEDSDFTNFGREDFNFFTDSIPLAFFEGGQAYDFEVRHPDFDGSNSVINTRKEMRPVG